MMPSTSRSNWLATVCWLCAAALPAQSPELPFDHGHLAEVRERLRATEPALAPAAAALRASAAKLLHKGPYSVVDKQQLPPSGDRHDFMSVGPYWWPNPDTEDGLPYVRRDGDSNPQRRDIPDAGNWGRLCSEANTLALAGYLLDEAQFQARAALLLRTWFVAPKTRMNPHLRYGQAIPGRVDGRDIGLIDTRKIYMILDAASLLDEAAWPAADRAALQQWCRDYLTWMTEGPFRTEGGKKNNHGTWYDVQVVALASFTENHALAKQVAERAKQRRIAAHIAPTGEQPAETERADGWAYSVMNLSGLCVLATLAEREGVDLWTFRTEDGRGIRQAFAYLQPHLRSLDEWPHSKRNSKNPARAIGLFLAAAPHFADEAFVAAAHALGKVQDDDALRLLQPMAK